MFAVFVVGGPPGKTWKCLWILLFAFRYPNFVNRADIYATAQPLEPSTRAVMDRIRARIIANIRLQGILADLQVYSKHYTM